MIPWLRTTSAALSRVPAEIFESSMIFGIHLERRSETQGLAPRSGSKYSGFRVWQFRWGRLAGVLGVLSLLTAFAVE
jgi:hypothetical protein